LSILQRLKLKYPRHFAAWVCSFQHFRKRRYSVFLCLKTGVRTAPEMMILWSLKHSSVQVVGHDCDVILPSESFRLVFREGISMEAALALFEVMPFFFHI